MCMDLSLLKLKYIVAVIYCYISYIFGTFEAAYNTYVIHCKYLSNRKSIMEHT